MTWKAWKRKIRLTLEAAGVDLEADEIAFIDAATGDDLIVTRDNDLIGVTTADDE